MNRVRQAKRRGLGTQKRCIPEDVPAYSADLHKGVSDSQIIVDVDQSLVILSKRIYHQLSERKFARGQKGWFCFSVQRKELKQFPGHGIVVLECINEHVRVEIDTSSGHSVFPLVTEGTNSPYCFLQRGARRMSLGVPH